ncbi:hypothetical protein CCR75_005317 [Bremia lactucae]|uniref:Uncharacterized protein n=1 Tax=Bremia lactucae TaxID=4779 RepID=A0A976IDJ6_BRELC|nr:hypothetical protein CCR75_005317 [Bremia lactucae]
MSITLTQLRADADGHQADEVINLRSTSHKSSGLIASIGFEELCARFNKLVCEYCIGFDNIAAFLCKELCNV